MFSGSILVVVTKVYACSNHVTMNLRLVNFIVYVNFTLKSRIAQKILGDKA